MASNDHSSSTPTNLPRGLIGRRGIPTGRGTRLPSIRAPRDLTLGGVPKKTFTPNIPIRRERIKEIEIEPENKIKIKDKKLDRSHSGKGHERGRGRGHGHGEYIQSVSIFEQGPTERINQRGPRDGFSTRSYDNRHISKGNDKTDLPLEIDEEKVKQLLESDDEDYDDDRIDKKFIPVVLPMKNTGVYFKKEIRAKKEIIKTEIVKSERESEDELMAVDENVKVNDELHNDIQPDPKTSKLIPNKLPEKVMTCRDIFCNEKNLEKGELIFIQMPDYFPWNMTSDEDNQKIKQEPEPSTSTTVPPVVEPLKENVSSNLKEIPEGLIGKLQILKSGKARLLLENIPFMIEVGSVGHFLQDLASIKISENTGDLAILGHVKHRLVCCPDIKYYASR